MLIDVDKEVKKCRKNIINLTEKLERYCNQNETIKTIVVNALDFSNPGSTTLTLGEVIRSAMYSLGWEIHKNYPLESKLEILHSFVVNCFLDDTFWYLDYRGVKFIGHTCDIDNSTQDEEQFLKLCLKAKEKHDKFREIHGNSPTLKDLREFYEIEKLKKIKVVRTMSATINFQLKDEDDLDVFKNTIFKRELEYSPTYKEEITYEIIEN